MLSPAQDQPLDVVPESRSRMAEALMLPLEITLVIFMAGNLLDMGLRLDPRDALRGLRDVRFSLYSLLWGFVLGPALAWVITRALALEPPYATGLLLLGMTPCAPFLPAILARAEADLGYTAAFMLLAAVGTVLFMPVAAPLLVEGMSIGAWTVAQPLVIVVLLPLVVGMLVLRGSPSLARRMQPVVKRATGLATIAVLVLCALVYGKGLLGISGSLAVAAQLLFFSAITVLSHLLAFGLRQEQRIVLSAGLATRNLGAAIAPLLSVPQDDQRATIMVVLGLPIMVIAALLATRWLGPRASSGEPGRTSAAPGKA
jgi:BASS family bile acid:Na+ symporter